MDLYTVPRIFMLRRPWRPCTVPFVIYLQLCWEHALPGCALPPPPRSPPAQECRGPGEEESSRRQVLLCLASRTGTFIVVIQIQCCGSGSGIRCLFDPWFRPESYFRELKNNFFGYNTWILVCVSGIRDGKIRIRDKIPDPQHCRNW